VCAALRAALASVRSMRQRCLTYMKLPHHASTMRACQLHPLHQPGLQQRLLFGQDRGLGVGCVCYCLIRHTERGATHCHSVEQ